MAMNASVGVGVTNVNVNINSNSNTNGNSSNNGVMGVTMANGAPVHWRDDTNVSQLLEEARACEQLGDYHDALTIYNQIVAMRPTDRWIHHHIASCRRELKEELLATGLYYKQERIISAAHHIGVTLEQPSFHLLPIATRLPLLLIEYERRLCWSALGDEAAVRNSTSTLSRGMGHEARQCWLAMADAYQSWGRLPLALQCTEHSMAIAAIEQSQPALSLEHPSLLARAGHLARLLGDSFRAEQMSREALAHAAGDALQEARLNLSILHWRQPSSNIPTNTNDTLSSISASTSVHDIATTGTNNSNSNGGMTPVINSNSNSNDNGNGGGSVLPSPNPSLLSASMIASRAKLRRYKQLEESVDYVSNILSSFDRNRADVNAAAYFWRGNFYLLQASVQPAIASYMQSLAVAYRYMLQQRDQRAREQKEKDARETKDQLHRDRDRDRDRGDGDDKRGSAGSTPGTRSQHSSNSGTPNGVSSTTWPNDTSGTGAVRDTSAEICGPHMEPRSVFQLEFSMYDLRHAIAAAASAAADGSATADGITLMSKQSRVIPRAHLLTRATFRGLVCFYTELLLRYGPNERVFWYRANAYKCMGDLQAYAHDLDRMFKQNERFLPDYLASPIVGDHRDDTILAWIQWELAQSVGLGVLTSGGGDASNQRLLSLMRRYYDGILSVPVLPCEDASYAIAAAADIARLDGHIDRASDGYGRALRLNPQNSIALAGTIALSVRSLDFDRVQRLTLAALENLSFEELKPVTTTVHALRRTATSPSQMDRPVHATPAAVITSSNGGHGHGHSHGLSNVPVAAHQVFSQSLGQQPLAGFAANDMDDDPILPPDDTSGHGIGHDRAWPADPTGEEAISSERYPIIHQIASYTQQLLPRYRPLRASTTALVAPLEGESHLFDTTAHRLSLANWTIVSQAALCLSQLAYSAHLRGDTHLCQWLIARARLIEPRNALAHAVAFIHHWRFSPLAQALTALSSLFTVDPFFTIGIDLTCQSLCVRYPLESDRPFPRLLSTQLRHAPYVAPLPMALALSAHVANPSASVSSMGQYHPLHRPSLPRSQPRKAGGGMGPNTTPSSTAAAGSTSNDKKSGNINESGASASSSWSNPFSARGHATSGVTSLATTPTPLSRDSSTPRLTPPHSPSARAGNATSSGSSGNTTATSVVHTPILAHAHLYASSYQLMGGSDKWPSLIWYREGLRLYQLHDTVGVLQCWSKAVEQTPDFSIALSYVLSLMETAMTQSGEAAVAPLRAEFTIDGSTNMARPPSRPITPSSSGGDLFRRGGNTNTGVTSAAAIAAASVSSSIGVDRNGHIIAPLPSPRTSPRSIARRMSSTATSFGSGGGNGASGSGGSSSRVLRPRPPGTITSGNNSGNSDNNNGVRARVDTGLGSPLARSATGLRRINPTQGGSASNQTPIGVASKRSIAIAASRPKTGGRTPRGIGSRPQTPSAASALSSSSYDDNGHDGMMNHDMMNAVEVPTRETIARLLGTERIHAIVMDVASRGRQLEHMYRQPELAYADYTLALLLLPTADVLWRRSLIAKRRLNIRAALGDTSMAILLTKQEQVTRAATAAQHSSLATPRVTSAGNNSNSNSNTISGSGQPSSGSLLAVSSSGATTPSTMSNNSGIGFATALQSSGSSSNLGIPGSNTATGAGTSTAGGSNSGGNTPRGRRDDGNYDQMLKRRLQVYHLVRSLLCYQLADYRACVNDATEAIQLNNDCLPAYRQRSLGYTRLGDYEMAIDDLRHFCKNKPRDMGCALRLANLYSFTGRHDDALRKMGQLLIAAPRSPPVLYSAALAYARDDQWSRARQHLQTCIFVDDTHMPAYMRMGEALERTGELEEALNVYMRALDINSQFPTLHRSIARAYIACAQRGYKAYLALQKEEDERVEADRLSRLKSHDNPELDRLRPLQRPPRVSPKTTSRHLGTGNGNGSSVGVGFSISSIALMAMGARQMASLDYVRSCLISAYNSLTTALANDHRDAEAHYLTALTLLFLDGNRSTANNAKILWSLDRAIQLEPAHANAHFLRGFALQRDKKLEQALDEYQSALDSDSNHLHALQARAYLHFLRGDRLKSAQAYSRILGLNPDAHFKAVIHANRGLSRMRNNELTAALNDFDTSLLLDSRHSLALLYRAECHRSMGYIQDAIADFREALPLLSAELEGAENERKLLQPLDTTTTTATAAATPTMPPGSLPSIIPSDGEQSPTSRTTAIDLNTTVNARHTPNILSITPAPAIVPSTIVDSNGQPISMSINASSGSNTPAALPSPTPSAISNIATNTGIATVTSTGTSGTNRERAAQRVLSHWWKRVQMRVRSGFPGSPTARRRTLAKKLGRENARGVSLLSAKPFVNSASASASVSVSPDGQLPSTPLTFPAALATEHFLLSSNASAALFVPHSGITTQDLASIQNSLGVLLHAAQRSNKRQIRERKEQPAPDWTDAERMALHMAHDHDHKDAHIHNHATNNNNSHSNHSNIGNDDILMSFDPSARELLRHGTGGMISRTDTSEAMDLFSSASTHFQGHYNRGLVFLEHNDIDRALAEFEHAVRTEPGYPNAHNNYGVVLERRGLMADAAREYEEAIRLQPLHRVACFNLANIKASLSHHAEAITLYSTFLKRHPPSSIKSSHGHGHGHGHDTNSNNDNGRNDEPISSSPDGATGDMDQFGDDGDSNYRGVDVTWLPNKPSSQTATPSLSSSTPASPSLPSSSGVVDDKGDGSGSGSGTGSTITGYSNSMEGMALLAGPRPPTQGRSSSMTRIAARRAAAAAAMHVAPGTAAAAEAAAQRLRARSHGIGMNDSHHHNHGHSGTKRHGHKHDASSRTDTNSNNNTTSGNNSNGNDDDDNKKRASSSTASASASKEGELSAGDEKVVQYLIPLALNNRAVCLTNQGLHHQALIGFNDALKLDGSLVFVKFNRAHLHMVLGDVHAALRDIRDVMRHRRNDYLNNFYAYCKRFQWALAVACKDYVTGLECLPIMMDLNLRCPVNPPYMFNPFNLIDPLSAEFSLLERLLSHVSHDHHHAQSPKLSKVMQDALSAQLVGNLRGAFQLLVEAGYLLPRHTTTTSATTTPATSLGVAASASSSSSDNKVSREYVGELKEIIALWRARIKIHHRDWLGAVDDLRFALSFHALGQLNVPVPSTDTAISPSPFDNAAISAATTATTDNVTSLPNSNSNSNSNVASSTATAAKMTSSVTGASGSSGKNREEKRVGWATDTPNQSDSGMTDGRIPVTTTRATTSNNQSINSNSNSNVDGGVTHHNDISMKNVSTDDRARRLRDSLLLNLMGTLYQLARDFKRARHCFTVATMQSPLWIYAHLNLGNLQRGRGRFQHAIKSYLAVVTITKNGYSHTIGSNSGTGNSNGHPLTDAQHDVCRVLEDYNNILALKPNHHWHKLTPLQGSLAMAVERCERERTSDTRSDVRPGSDISARELLDRACHEYISHLLHARRSQITNSAPTVDTTTTTAIAATATSRPAMGNGNTGGPMQPQSHATAILEEKFQSAFARLQSSIQNEVRASPSSWQQALAAALPAHTPYATATAPTTTMTTRSQPSSARASASNTRLL